MALDDFLRGHAGRANPTAHWFLDRRPSGAPPGAPWERLPQAYESWADVEAELTAPTGLLAPGDLVRFGAGALSTHWWVGADGLGRRLPALLDLVHRVEHRDVLAPWGDDWWGAWEGADDGELLLVLADGAGVSRRAIVAAALAAVRPDVEAILGADEAAERLGPLDAWLDHGLREGDLSAARGAASRRTFDDSQAASPDASPGRNPRLDTAHAIVELFDAATGAYEGAAAAAARGIASAVFNRTPGPPQTRYGAMLAASRRQADAVRSILPFRAVLEALEGG